VVPQVFLKRASSADGRKDPNALTPILKRASSVDGTSKQDSVVKTPRSIRFESEKNKTTPNNQTKPVAGYAQPTGSARGRTRNKVDDAAEAVAELMGRKLPPREVFGRDIPDPRPPLPPGKDMHGVAIRENQLQIGRQKHQDHQSDLQKAEKARQNLLTRKPAKLPGLDKKK